MSVSRVLVFVTEANAAIFAPFGWSEDRWDTWRVGCVFGYWFSSDWSDWKSLKQRRTYRQWRQWPLVSMATLSLSRLQVFFPARFTVVQYYKDSVLLVKDSFSQCCYSWTQLFTCVYRWWSWKTRLLQPTISLQTIKRNKEEPIPNSDGLQPTSDGLQPNSDDLQPMPYFCGANGRFVCRKRIFFSNWVLVKRVSSTLAFVATVQMK